MVRMATQWHEFAEFVRRALHDAADDIEPEEDGLEPIRARIPAWSGLRDRQAARRRHRPGARRGARHGGPGPQQNRS
jgi:hypothetical protein